MSQRLNMGKEVRELKLGSTFNSSKSRSSFHTLKYDFKPASIDLSKTAALDVSSNNQVTVTMPHMSSSGVPKTVFKGNQRNYTKECVLIIDKVTGQITLEKLHHNIQVKKTRSEIPNNKTSSSSSSSLNANGNGNIASASAAAGTSAGCSSSNNTATTTTNQRQSQPPMPQLMENNTQRVSNKTRVSTGVRKNAIGSFVQKHSPIQGSPSYPNHRSPQQAPAWNANNSQSTLPSIPLIGMDDDDEFMPMTTPSQSSNQHHAASSSSLSSSKSSSHMAQGTKHRSNNSSKLSQNSNKSTTINNTQANVQQQQQQQQPIHNERNSYSTNSSSNNSSNNNRFNNNPTVKIPVQTQQYQPKDDLCEVGVLSSSDSSDSSDSDSNSSDSDSDSDDEPAKPPAPFTNGTNSLPTLLDEDLRLSNSSDSDD